MIDSNWAPQRCTRAIACPKCGVPAGESCLSDRPLHLERWDAWKATGFAEQKSDERGTP